MHGRIEQMMQKGIGPYQKGVIIGAGTEALHTIELAHKFGIHITALDGNPKADGLAVADCALTVDISDQSAVIEVLKEVKPDFVLTVPIGRYLTTVGAVNDALHLPGISEQMAVLCTDKYDFHNLLARNGLRACECYRIPADGNTQEVNSQFIDFPAILKPRYGSGSRGIFFINNKEELENALYKINGEEYVLEECVAGEEYGVDGAVIEGTFHLVLLRKKENTPLPARQAVAYYSVQPADAFWSKVKIYMEKVVRCLGLQECLLHADMIQGEKGPFVIELSARPSGHYLHNLFTPLCTGIDLAEEYIKYRMKENYNFTPVKTKNMLIHYFDMEGRVSYVPSRDEVKEMTSGSLVDWKCLIQEGEILTPVSDGHSIMGRGYFVLEAAEGNDKDTREELKQNAEAVKQLFFR